MTGPAPSRRWLALILGSVILVGLAPPVDGLDPTRAPAQYRIRSWTTAGGLPVNSVHAIVEDATGYLWLGTEEGLVRFDGVRMQVFDRHTNPGIGNHMIQALAVASDGTLWAGTQGGLLISHDGRFRTLTVRDGLPDDAVLSLCPGSDGEVWVGTVSGLCRVRGDGLLVERPFPELDGVVVRALLLSRSGVLWVGTRTGLLTIGSDGVVAVVPGVPETPVSGFFEDHDGVVWIVTNGAGLLAVSTDGRVTRWTRADGLPLDNVLAVTGDLDGNLWIGSNGGGLARFRDGRFDSLGVAQGLSGDLIRALAADRDGTLWVGTMGGGVSQLGDSAFASWTTAEGMAAKVVLPILEAHDGSMWFGTAGGGVSRLAEGRVESFGIGAGLPHAVVLGLAETVDGTLWAGTAGGGLARLVGSRFEAVSGSPELASALVTALLAARDGGLWIGTTNGGIHFMRDGRVQRRGPPEWMADDAVYQMLEAEDGSLWVGGNRTGLYQLRGDEVRDVTAELGVPRPPVVSLLEVEPGKILAGTGGTGLVLIDGDRVSACTKSDGLGDDVVLQLLDDGLGYLWMGSNRGVFRLRRDDLMRFFAGDLVRVECDRFDAGDGLPSAECNAGFQPAGCRSRDGRLWFPTAAGAAVVDPSKVFAARRAPPATVEEARCAAAAWTPADAEPLVCLDRRMTVEYTAFSYVKPEDLRFRYRLLGFDGEWVDAGTRRTAYYTNLPPGRFTFEVEASLGGSEGPWDRASLSVLVPGRWYESPLVYAAGGLAAVGLGWGLSRRHVKRLRRRQAELEMLIREREEAQTALVESEARLHQAQKLEALGRLAGGVAHDFNNILLAITSNSELILMTAPEGDPVREEAEEILRASQRAAGLTRQLLAFSRRQEVSPRRIDLNEALRGTTKLLGRLLGEDVAVSLELAKGPCWLMIDPTQLEQVVINLAVNARDAMTSGGRLTLRTSSRRLAAGEAGDLAPGCYHEIEVEDTGAGMDEQTRSRVFEPFFTTKGVGQGTGLGLATVYGVVRQVGGAISVRSAPGEGTCFSVLLPASEGVAEVRQAVAPGSPARLSARVLVVEDDRQVRSAVVRMLRRLGALVVEAPGPEEAERLVSAGEEVDVVLSDVVMPGGSGEELARRLQALRPGLAAVLMSGHTADMLARHGAEATPFLLLHKPFTVTELADTLRAVLGQTPGARA